MSSLPKLECETAQPLGRWCTLLGILGKDVELQAVARYGGRFLGWKGANCPQMGKCRFKLKLNPRVSITARFG